MDYMFAACSTTAQRGALDWAPKFEAASKPVFEALYQSVKDGKETARVLDTCSSPDYRQKLDTELKAIRESEMWKTGSAVRSLRPENWGGSKA
ncbi:MAG: ketol-acid reductoisomerase, partial [bacterium]